MFLKRASLEILRRRHALLIAALLIFPAYQAFKGIPRTRSRPAQALLDFGRSDHFDAPPWRYHWAPLPAKLSYQAQPDTRARVAGQPAFALFAPPLSAITVQSECSPEPVLIRLRDRDGRTFRIVTALGPEAQGDERCENAFVSANREQLASIDVFRLAREPIPQVAMTQATAVPWLRVGFTSQTSFLDLVEAPFAQALPELSAGDADFRLVDYYAASTRLDSTIARTVRLARQSLILISSRYMAESRSASVRWLEESPDFPVYFVARGPLAHSSTHDIPVTHAKAYTFGNRIGQLRSLSLGPPPVGTHDFAIDLLDPSAVSGLAETIIEVLDPARRTSTHEVAHLGPGTELLYRKPRAWSANARHVRLKDETAANGQDATPEYARIFAELRSARQSIRAVLVNRPSSALWDALASSTAMRIEIVYNAFHEDFDRSYVTERLRVLRKARPGREVRFIAARFPASELPPSYLPLHYRFFLVDQDSCVISQSSFANLGGVYSDDFSLVSHAPELCGPFSTEYDRLVAGSSTGVIATVVRRGRDLGRLLRWPAMRALGEPKIPIEVASQVQ